MYEQCWAQPKRSAVDMYDNVHIIGNRYDRHYPREHDSTDNRQETEVEC